MDRHHLLHRPRRSLSKVPRDLPQACSSTRHGSAGRRTQAKPLALRTSFPQRLPSQQSSGRHWQVHYVQQTARAPRLQEDTSPLSRSMSPRVGSSRCWRKLQTQNRPTHSSHSSVKCLRTSLPKHLAQRPLLCSLTRPRGAGRRFWIKAVLPSVFSVTKALPRAFFSRGTTEGQGIPTLVLHEASGC